MLLYGALFLLSGIALVVVTYVLVDAALPPVAVRGQTIGASRPSFEVVPPSGLSPGLIRAQQRTHDLHNLVVGSSIALVIMTLAAVVVGWLVAGRVLRPLRTITGTTRQISENNLHQRLSLPGPRDELRDLGDTIDGLLERLDAAFEAQRSFVTNASHELRTPLTLSRVTLQVALCDPHLTLQSLRVACEEAIETGRQQEQLIEALLTLARSQRGLAHRDPLDLAAVSRKVVHTHLPAASTAGLRFDVSLAPAPVLGDSHLVELLVGNLVDNAIRYNVPDGEASIAVENRLGAAVLTVTNTGPVVSGAQVSRLLQPFQRIAQERVGDREGLGLGLSIVQSITAVHGGELCVTPREAGGLEIEVRFEPTVERRPSNGGTETRSSVNHSETRDPGRH